MKYILLPLLFLLVYLPNSAAQKNYTDHKPKYRQWQSNYILDKIEYTADEMIFYFRFQSNSSSGAAVTYYPPGDATAWYLKADDGKKYPMKSLQNVRRNGQMLNRKLRSTTTYDNVGVAAAHTCEIHFARLPNEVKKVDLIEGLGYENNDRHFNCFDIAVKTWNDEELGSEEDSEETIRRFQNQFSKINPRPKPKEENESGKIERPKPKDENNTARVDKPKPEPEKKKTVVKRNPPPDPNNPYAPIPRLRNERDLVCGQKIVLGNLQFQDNSPRFTGLINARQTLDYIFDYMREYPESKLTVYGHSDIFGNQERNEELSRQRALEVQHWLSGLGIDPERIKVEFYGGKQPVKPEGDPLNRRVEFQLSCD